MDITYGILKYSIDVLCTYISYQTDTPFSYVKQKNQIKYIDNYLYSLTESNIAFVYENEYIDKGYLEDFAYYYSKCFKSYKKTCCRIHFFKMDSSCTDQNIRQKFNETLSGKKTFINQKNYLGYIVVRPLPQSFFAKICLKSYCCSGVTSENSSKYVIKKTYNVSLFGMNLKIDSIAFQEQDKILAACATTSLWTFFHAHPNYNKHSIPSLSAITQSAYPLKNGYSKEFPSPGLSADMICRSLRANDFIPETFEFSSVNTDKKIKAKNLTNLLKESYEWLRSNKKIISLNKINIMKEYIHAYCSSGFPIILGVSVYNNNRTVFKGLHAITILGFGLSDEEGGQWLSHKLEKLYVHDDRIGPFLKIEFKNDVFRVVLADKQGTEKNLLKEEIYIPDALIIGVYNKIRIPYSRIKNTCSNIQKLVSDFVIKLGRNDFGNFIQRFTWDIKIKINSELKQSIRKSKIINKEKFLTDSWPKYIWSATASFQNIPIIEILFDATDIDHGNVFIDIIPMEEEIGYEIIKIFEQYSHETFVNKYGIDSTLNSPDDYVWGIIKYFRSKETYLDTLRELFGYLKIPKLIKPQEIHNNEIVKHCDARLDRKGDYSLKMNLQHEHQYIWVIDKDGFLCIGIEDIKAQQGHPTLTDGMPARIGGQLKYDSNENIWIVDPFSGRYSSEYTVEDKEKYVQNAINYRFSIFFPENNFQLLDTSSSKSS